MIKYTKHFFGYEPLSANTKTHWLAKNMPSFTTEAFVNSADNYVTKFEFDIQAYTFPGYYREFTTDWNAVARRMDESSYFGYRIKNASYLNSTIKEIEAKDSTIIGRLQLAYDAAKTIKWNDETHFQTSTQNLGTIWHDKVGNSADINLILVNLLRKLDIEANPVVLSTRDNGLLPVFSPSINKLNYVIVEAKINDKTYLLDATDEYAPIGILPKRCYNGSGQALIKSNARKVAIKPNAKKLQMELYNLTLEDDMSITGNTSKTFADFAALDYRHFYNSFNSDDEIIEQYEEKNAGVKISDLEIANLNELDKNVQEKYKITIRNQVQQIDTLYYFIPLLHLKTKDNPFKSDERKYPVSFAYNETMKQIIQLSIPSNFKVISLPKSISISLPGNGGKVIYQVQVSNNKVSVMYRYSILKSQFLIEEYQYLRELYNQIIKKQSEPIILSKNENFK